MAYIRKCPYCNTMMQEIVYAKDNVNQYAFMCDCTKGELKYNRDAAYEQYLHEREDNQATNFDKYFAPLGTWVDLDDRLDKSCEIYDGNCEECPWGIIGRKVSNGTATDCFGFWNWVKRKVKGD